MRTPFHLFLLFSLIALAGLLAPASPGRADSDAVITVTTTNDELNKDADCSLREAIRAANTNNAVSGCPAGIGADTIMLPEGFYQLSMAGVNEDDAMSGDLDIKGNLVIQGSGRDVTIVDGNSIDRVFHNFAGTSLAPIVIRSLTIQNGVAGDEARGGGAILNQGTVKLIDVVLNDNSASNVGGGIDNPGTATIEDSTILNNQAEDGGGIFNSEGGTLILKRSTLSGNIATIESGGGLDNSGSGTLENVTISGNSAQDGGGGIFSDGVFLAVLNSTIVDNAATSYPLNNGGNVESANEIRFINTLVANSPSGRNCAGSGFTSLGHNLDSENTCNFNQSTDLYNTGDPLIGVLKYNGGSTLTHALLEGSPAIDTGDNSILVCPIEDQRGYYRPAVGVIGSSAVCDIGAYEYYIPILIPIVMR